MTNRNTLVEDNLALVPFFMERMHLFGDRDDLEQAGRIGLMKAAERHDPSRGAFSTIAGIYIQNYIRRESDKQRHQDSPFRKHDANRLRLRTIEELEAQLHRHPTRDEVIAEVGVKVADTIIPGNLSIEPTGDWDDLESDAWVAVEDTEPVMIEELQLLDFLDPDDTAVLVSWGMGYTAAEIAEPMGLHSDTILLRIKRLKAEVFDLYQD